jgi:hypothetical protein
MASRRGWRDLGVILRHFHLLGVALVVIGYAAPAQAIPPFARRYGFSCSTCHVGSPNKLSEFGEAFRDNGYRIPGDDESYLRENPVPLGDPARSELFPSVLWPGQLPSMVPIGVSTTANFNYTAPQAAKQADTITPSASASLLLGGSLGRYFSFFGEITGSTTNGLSVGQICLIFRGLLAPWIPDGALNVKVGRLVPDLLPVQPGLRRGLSGPIVAQTNLVGKDGFGYGMSGDGIELWGLLGGHLKWVVGILNGIKPVDDTTTRRDFFGRLQLKLGGERLDYRGAHPDSRSGINFLVGVAGYWGATVVTPAMPAMAPNQVNRVERLSGDLRLRLYGLDLYGIVVVGRDSDPDQKGYRVDSLAYTVEADWAVLPWLQPYARYDEAWFDDPSNTRQTRRRVASGMVFAIRPNIKLTVEGTIGLVTSEPYVAQAQLFFAL